MTTILHISDLHYGKQAFSDEVVGLSHTQSLDSSLRLALADRRVQWLVVSGDLTQRAAAEEFQAAAAGLQRLAVALSIPLRRIVVCPGNHDVDWAVAETQGSDSDLHKLDNYRRFLETLYGGELSAFYLGYPNSLVGTHDDEETGTCAVTMASCVLERRDSPFGYIGKKQLATAVQALRATKAPTKLAVMHHHALLTPADVLTQPPAAGARPDPGVVTALDMSIMRDAGVVLGELGAAGTRFIFHGHKHDPLIRSYRDISMRCGAITAFGAGSAGVDATELPPGRRHHAYLLDLSRGVPSLASLEAVDGRWTVSDGTALWQLYDELEELLRVLRAQRVSRGASPSLLDFFIEYALSKEPITSDAQRIMQNLASIPKNKAGHLDVFFWKAVVIGLFQFKDINQFYEGEGDSWEEGVDFVQVSGRGQALLHRLREARSGAGLGAPLSSHSGSSPHERQAQTERARVDIQLLAVNVSESDRNIGLAIPSG